MTKIFLPIVPTLATFMSSGDMIRACVDANGTIRIVSANTNCGSHGKALEWSTAGLQGPKGETGAQGPQGEPGVGNIGCDWKGGYWRRSLAVW